MTPVIEHLGLEDILEIMELENLYFPYSWTKEQFCLSLKCGAYNILGVRLKGRIVGYSVFSMIQDEMEIINLAVHSKFQRRGFGAKLMDAILGHSRAAGVKYGFLDVKESNISAINFYSKFGFNKIGIRKNYYPDTSEDALLFRCNIF